MHGCDGHVDAELNYDCDRPGVLVAIGACSSAEATNESRQLRGDALLQLFRSGCMNSQ
jgi:hypothetical protein